ncbi:hypothetical protein SG34_017125 [Thalassomonas viridans]|uniref:Uncharacterized protein n=1 Tax=Thalassomonas viridans TaxID=137584 RepID=A0AAE9YXN4_9GAMM|nr:hypothetical protein [Thalassomonas viridans]WDE03131.1 hypothetical protein SG34_017125 [Thalassomonas viridans]
MFKMNGMLRWYGCQGAAMFRMNAAVAWMPRSSDVQDECCDGMDAGEQQYSGRMLWQYGYRHSYPKLIKRN